nr:SPOR domain-containing protein [Kineosporia babensis]
MSSASQPEAEQEQAAEGDSVAVSRWSLQAPGIDVFWPILAAVLTTIVIVVALVAHSSMAAVGVGTPRTDWAPRPTPEADQPFVVVQVASFPSRDEGQSEVRKLRQSGLDAAVLKSDRYAPMNEGWYVVYIGPFTADAEGRAQAKKFTKDIEGSLVRTLHRR